MTQLRGTSLLRQIRRVVAAQCPSRQSDVQLLQQFMADRDEAAFAALVHRHGPMVLGVCRHVLHHQQDAEDVFQAVFLVLARKPHAIRKHHALSSWLHGVAYRLSLKARARRQRRQACEQAAPTRPAIMPEDLTVRELGMILHAEMQSLPDVYRSSLLLCYWEGKTRDEAADRLGMTPGTFKKRLERARSLLGDRLTRRGLTASMALFGMLVADHGARGAVSASLIQNTTAAALAFAAGNQATTTASTFAVALAEGAIQAMNMTKWITTLAIALVLSGFGAVLGLAGYQALYGEPADRPALAAAIEGQQPTQDKVKPAGAKKSDQERLLGVWKMAKSVVDGQDLPADVTTLARFTFGKDGMLTMSIATDVSEGSYKFLGKGKIDLTMNKRQDASPGIYKFDGDDRFIFCASKDENGKRPTEFSGDKDSGQVLMTLVRAKPGEEKPSAEEIAKYADPVARVKEAVARTVSANNLKQIGLAMHNYHDANGALPKHAIYSKDGKTPLLSWRVAILPYIEQTELYRAFKLDEPWDSAHNKKLIAKMPTLYEMPIGEKHEGMTNYQLFTGPGTAFDGDKKITLLMFARGTSDSVLGAEAKNAVIWTKPADLELPADKDKLPAVGNHFRNGFHIIMADGSVRMLGHESAPKVLRGAIPLKDGN